MTLMPGEDREFKNQFTEFLKKNIILNGDTKKDNKVKKTRKKRVAKNNLEYFINT